MTQIISWLQIVGGILGLGLIANLMLHTETINGPVLLILLIGLTLYIYSVYAGSKLLMEKHTTTGIIHSIINQGLQLFQWGICGYEFLYSSGAAVTVGIEGLTLRMQLTVLTSKFDMAINSGDGFFFKINLLALVIIFILIHIVREQKGAIKNPVAQ